MRVQGSYGYVTAADMSAGSADDGAVTDQTQQDPAGMTSRSAHPDSGGPRTADMPISQRPTTSAGQPPVPDQQPWRPGVPAAGLVGVIATGLAIGIAELIAGFGEWIGVLNTPASPLSSLGQTFIQFTPEWLKEFAINTFGQNDKVALSAGMGITLFLVAVAIGIVGRINPRAAVAITVALILLTAAAIYSRAGASFVDLLPILLGGAAGTGERIRPVD